jgi:hypothetical protein
MINIVNKQSVKYIFLIIFFIFITFFLHGKDVNWSENYFPFSAEVLGSGNTFSSDLSANYISPALKGNSNIYFSTSFLKSNAQIYYFVYGIKNFTFDLFYYDWNKIEWRDEMGRDLGYYYSSNYSGSVSYIHSLNKFKGGMQIRYNLKEIGSTRETRVFFSPFLYYNIDIVVAGITLKDYKNKNIIIFGGFNYRFLKLKTRIDYYNEEYKFNYGCDFYLNEKNNYVLFLGAADKKFTAGFAINSDNIKFSYGFIIENEQFFVNNFGLKIEI